MQTINSVNLCYECIEGLVMRLKDTNIIPIDNLKVMNMYLTPMEFTPNYPKEQEALYSNLHISCNHPNRCNIAHDYTKKEERTSEDIKGILLSDRIKLTNDTRKFIVNNVAKELKKVHKRRIPDINYRNVFEGLGGLQYST